MKEDRDAVAPWIAMDSNWWQNIAIELPKPWPRDAVMMDLRWWSDQERMGRKKRPGRAALSKRWGWGHKRVRNAMKAEETWGSPVIHRGQRGASEGPAGGQKTNPKIPKSQKPRAMQGPCRGQVGAPRAELQKNKTTEQQSSLESSKEDMSVSDLWKEINKARKEAGSARALTLTQKRRRWLTARLKKPEGREQILRVVDWWLRSDHHRAVWVRENYGWDTVQRKFDEYLELSYEDAKRTHDHRKPKHQPTMSDLLAERRARRDQLNVVVFPLTPSQGTTNGD